MHNQYMQGGQHKQQGHRGTWLPLLITTVTKGKNKQQIKPHEREEMHLIHTKGHII